MRKLKNLLDDPQVQHILVGMAITGLLIATKFIFEQFPIGHRIELLTFELLQGQLTGIDKAPLPVVVLDISSIPGGTEEEPTPLKPLEELIEAIAAGGAYTKPKAIGIDIDFSPGLQTSFNNAQIHFFETCLKKRDQIPVYLGIHRTIGSPAKTWLGLKEFAPLAAGIYADPSNTSRLPVWFKRPGVQEEVLPSFAAALTTAYRGEDLPAPKRWLKPLVKSDHTSEIELDGTGQHVLISERLVNYSKLELLQQTTVPIKSKEGIAQILELLNNKVVILGRNRNATDRFRVPGRDETVPGVFLHASAVQTLIKEPLFELRLAVRLIVDFLISLLIISLVAKVRFAKTPVNANEWHHRHRKYTYTAALLVFVTGLFLVTYASVMWLDFVPLIIALLLHPYVEKKVEEYLERRQKVPAPKLEVTP